MTDFNENIKVNEDFIPFGSFITEDYKSIKAPEYDLQLCKLTEEPIAELHNIENFVLTKGIMSIDEITFDVHKYIYTSSGKRKPNPLFDLVEGNMLVFVNEMQYFILSKPKIMAQGTEMPHKSIKGYSREYELSQKIIDGYKGVSRVLYDESNTKDEEGFEYGYLNYIENNTSWTVGYYNKDINKKHRALNLNGNILRSTEEVQKTFGCVFVYDTIDKLIHVYDPAQLGKNQGIYISDENYISELTQDIEDEAIVTRLYLYGNENISINSLTPTGQPFIQDFSYYKDTKFMTQGLIDGLDKFDEAVNGYYPTFKELLADEKTYTEDLTLAKINLREQEGELRILEHEWDTIVAEDGDLGEINSRIAKKKKEVAKYESEVSTAQTNLGTVSKKKKALQDKLALEKYLTTKEIKELDYFIKEEKFFDNNYTRENIEEMLEEGKKVLAKISKPKLTFQVSVDDFLRMAEGRFMWHRFRLGDIITLEHKSVGFDYEVRLIGYTHTPEDHSLELKFSSVDSLYDSAIYLEEILEEAIDVSNTVDFNKFKWDKGEDISNEFSDYINHNLDLSNQALSKAEGQRPMLDDRGLWLYKEMPDGSVSPEQVRAINNVIAITKDNWETVEWALTPNGIMAKQLVGDIILGTDLKIISDSGVVEIMNNLITIKDDKGRLRVALGNYSNGKYGLQIKDKEGRNTILDEDGMLQVWQDGRTDNTDADNPLEISLFIPRNTRYIYDVRLRVKKESFRAYSKATDTKKAYTTTAKNDGEVSYTDEEWNGVKDGDIWLRSTQSDLVSITTGREIRDHDMEYYDTRSDSELIGYRYGTHNHGVTNGDWWKVQRRDQWGNWEEASVSFAESGAHHHGSHTHRFTLPEHGHSIKMPSHSHALYIPAHDHPVEIEGHGHEILPAIYKTWSSSRFRIRVNGSYANTWTSLDVDNLDITKYIQKGWNTITVETTGISRIDATVFTQCLLNFDGLTD